MNITRLDSHRCAVFLLTFFSYAFFHANRKAFSNVKASTAKVWTPSIHNESLPALQPNEIWNSHNLFDSAESAEHFEGILDTSFMLAYALGLFLNGYVGDRVNMRILLTFGMAGTSVTVFIFGCVCEWAEYYNEYFYVFIWVINGLLQSTGWPVVVACMGNWFGQSSRGMLLGIWSSCASVGNIIGTFMAASVLSYGYQYAFLMTSCVLLSGAFMIFFGLVTSPEDVGIEIPKDDEYESPEKSTNTDTKEQRESDNNIFVISEKLPVIESLEQESSCTRKGIVSVFIPPPMPPIFHASQTDVQCCSELHARPLRVQCCSELHARPLCVQCCSELYAFH